MPPPKAGQVVDHTADLLSQRAAFKTELPHKNEKQTRNCNHTWRAEGMDGMLNTPQRKGTGQRTKLSVNKHSNKPPPKPELISDQRAAFKTKLPHLTGGEADKTAAAG
jgi:hypothetical protein